MNNKKGIVDIISFIRNELEKEDVKEIYVNMEGNIFEFYHYKNNKKEKIEFTNQ